MKRKSCTLWENSVQSSNYVFFKYPPVSYRNPIGSRLLFQSHHFSGANCHVKLLARNTPKILVHFLVCSRWHPQRDDWWLVETNLYIMNASFLNTCTSQTKLSKLVNYFLKQSVSWHKNPGLAPQAVVVCGCKTATTNGQSCILFCPEDSGTVKPLCKHVDIKINWSS